MTKTCMRRACCPVGQLTNQIGDLFQEFDFKEVKKLMKTTPHLSLLMFSVGQLSEEAAGPHMTVKDIHSLSALCVLAKKEQQPDQWFSNSCGFDADCPSYQ